VLPQVRAVDAPLLVEPLEQCHEVKVAASAAWA
jgi:hypothetical protein